MGYVAHDTHKHTQKQILSQIKEEGRGGRQRKTQTANGLQNAGQNAGSPSPDPHRSIGHRALHIHLLRPPISTFKPRSPLEHTVRLRRRYTSHACCLACLTPDLCAPWRIATITPRSGQALGLRKSRRNWRERSKGRPCHLVQRHLKRLLRRCRRNIRRTASRHRRRSVWVVRPWATKPVAHGTLGRRLEDAPAIGWRALPKRHGREAWGRGMPATRRLHPRHGGRAATV
eukprot:scaffold183_cov108-Isochrysis_galbana.AAC.2